MTSLQLELPPFSGAQRARPRSRRSTRSASQPRRIGMVSEAVVARYIRDLAAHDHRVQGAIEDPQGVTR